MHCIRRLPFGKRYTIRMQSSVIVSWQARERDLEEKAPSWYWAVGIVAAGVALAALIVGDYLFSLIAVIGGFTVMLVGSTKPKRHTYQVTERGLMIGKRLIPYRAMMRFAIHEDPRTLAIETDTISGIISVPLGDVDHRTIEMEFKNKNVEEVDSLHSFVDHVARGMGL